MDEPGFKSLEDIQADQKRKAAEFATAASKFFNTFSDDTLKQAAKLLTDTGGLHRSLQGTVLRFFLFWCQEMALHAAAGRYDPRNKQACHIAQSIAAVYDPNKLPR